MAKITQTEKPKILHVTLRNDYEVYSRDLRTRGYSVEEVHTRSLARERLTTNQYAGVLLTSLRISPGRDKTPEDCRETGIGLLVDIKKIERRRNKQIPVIIITSAESALLRRIEDMGYQGCTFHGPVPSNYLAEQIRRRFRSAQS